MDLLQFLTCSLRIHCCCRLLWCLAWSLEASSCLLSSFRDAIVLYSIVTTRKCFPVLWFKGPLLSVGIKVCIAWSGRASPFICVPSFRWMALNSNRSIEVFKFFLSFKGWKVRVIAVTSLESVFNPYKLVIDFGERCFLVAVTGTSIPVLCFDRRKSDFLFFSECWTVGLMSGRNFCFCCSSFLGGHGKATVNCLRIGDGLFLFSNTGGIAVDPLKPNSHWERARGKGMISIASRVEENFSLHAILLC